MAGVNCCVPYCGNTYLETRFTNRLVSYFKFPNEACLKAVWINQIRPKDLPDWIPSSSYVCSEHFLPSDFTDTAPLYDKGKFPLALSNSAIPLKTRSKYYEAYGYTNTILPPGHPNTRKDPKTKDGRNERNQARRNSVEYASFDVHRMNRKKRPPTPPPNAYFQKSKSLKYRVMKSPPPAIHQLILGDQPPNPLSLVRKTMDIKACHAPTPGCSFGEYTPDSTSNSPASKRVNCNETSQTDESSEGGPREEDKAKIRKLAHALQKVCTVGGQMGFGLLQEETKSICKKKPREDAESPRSSKKFREEFRIQL